MLAEFKKSTRNQYHAALCTLDLCCQRCPDEGWNQPVHELAFCQAAFHALFFGDLYLGNSIEEMKAQPFHQQHADVFRDYEEIEPRRQVLMYERPWIHEYVQHCKDKVTTVMEAVTEQSLKADTSIPWYDVSGAEFHINNIRHLHHHAAQLILVLRRDHNVEMPWVSSGWKTFES